MKRILLSLAVACLLTSLAAAQSLGEIARKNREKKGTTSTGKVYTNETLPQTSTFASESRTTQAAAQESTSTTTTAAAAAIAEEEEGAVDPKEEEAKWRARFKEQKDEIALLERELTVTERENKLRAAAFYGDAGTRLRDEAKYAAEDRKYKQETEEKKQKLTEAKQKLEDLREELRKAGKPASWGE
ncbi:MAG: hypothetical protein ACRD2Y_09075 [Terriglobales bacterium]